MTTRLLDQSIPERHNLNKEEYMMDFSTNHAVQTCGRVLNDTALFYLKSVSPWLRFLGIINYIVCGLMAAGGLIVLIAEPLLANLGMGGEMGFLIGISYLLSSLAMFFPAHFMYSFGSRIRDYFLSGAEEEIAFAFKYNKSYWKYCGVITIIILALTPIGISVAIYAISASYF
jgi:hypothetical protein